MPTAPNLLWIVTTQWRAQACGYAGDPHARTPHLDALAAESIDYAEAVTPHPFGPFARAALLTGTPSPENGVRNYFDPLPRGAETIAHRLRRLGYLTAFFGKWHLGRRNPAAPLVGEVHARQLVPPDERGGFDFWEGFEGGFLLNDPWLHGSRLPEPCQFSGYQSDVLTARAAGWLARPGPWFAVVSLEPPHPPYDAPASGVEPADPAALRLPPNVPPAAAPRARAELAGYYAHLEATDRALGRLVAAVERARPIIVVTSVHGDMHGAHGCFRKGWPYEESVRVPLLVRRPGVAPRRDRSAVSLLDLPSLTLAWARGATDHEPAPEAARISMPSVVGLPWQCDRLWRGLRSPARKLVLNSEGTPWLHFDLERDPFELENLAGRADHRADLAAWCARLRDGA